VKIAETFFVGGRPRGQILVETDTGEIAFLPRMGERAPPARSWQSVDQLKATLRELYGNPGRTQ
jgi:hypothetical protein